MAAGKSTKAVEIAREHNAILLCEDTWLRQLYPDMIKVFDDYIKYSARLKPLLKTLVADLLNAGLSVVMDFPANTPKQRAWFKEILSENNVSHQLHYLEVDDELCHRQLKHRSADLPEGAAFTSEDEFNDVNRYFQAPEDDEGWNVKRYVRDD